MTTETTTPDPSGVLSLPTATPGAIPDAPGEPAATAGPDGPGPLDPAVHEIDKATGLGRMNKAGTRWMLKRGNGARQAAGKPLAGSVKSRLVIPPDAMPPASQAAPGPQSAPGGPATPSQVADAVKSGATVNVLPSSSLPPPPIPMDDYEATAVGVTHATWGIFQMFGGEKWKPQDGEVDDWRRCWQRIWHRYQWPLLVPLAELIILFTRSAARRVDTSKARGFFAGAWRWARGGQFNDPDADQANTRPAGEA